MVRATSILLLLAALFAAGCGSAGGGDPVGTVRAWSQALTRGDQVAAAALFAIPSIAQLDPTGPAGRIGARADARALDESLPCGARLLDARPRGRYIDALFLLTRRPGASCDGPGATARVAFRISDGKIAEWRRIADEPGDAARGTAPAPARPPGSTGSPRAQSV
ncbi:MAG: hypothetical protein NVSMB51_05240 [Solirubrobacteraceae bacterium]